MVTDYSTCCLILETGGKEGGVQGWERMKGGDEERGEEEGRQEGEGRKELLLHSFKSCRKSQLFTDHQCLLISPQIITDGSPHFKVVDLHTAIAWIGAID